MIRSSSNSLVATAAVAVLMTTGVAHAFQVPNFKGTDTTIGSPGYPDFWSANLEASLAKSSGGDYTLSIRSSDPNVGIFNFPNGAYLVGNEQIKLSATFDSTGHLEGSGSYEVDGSLAAWSKPSFGTKPAGFSWATQPVEKLFSASLTSVTVDSKDEALGFKSTDFGGWANQKQFTGTSGKTTESVWLYSLLSGLGNWSSAASTSNANWDNFLAEIKSHGKGGLVAGNFFGIGSIATVPIPAALWLFGSGLAGLGGVFRRRRAEVNA